ncbi:MAG: hypothetical protein LW825_02820 [Candidatus Jidaibacter sp.]|jgi:hypothetical protein|nr:hypothetical protein [Candidatus Jidaibacter sp.]
MITDPKIEALLRKASPILLPDVFFDSFDQEILNMMLLNSAKIGNLRFFNLLLKQGAEITEDVKKAAEGKAQILEAIEPYESFVKSFNEKIEELKEDVKNNVISPENIGTALDGIFNGFLTNDHKFWDKIKNTDFILNFFERIKVGFMSFIKGQNYDDILVQNVSEKLEVFFESIKANIDKDVGFAARLKSQKAIEATKQNQR